MGSIQYVGYLHPSIGCFGCMGVVWFGNLGLIHKQLMGSEVGGSQYCTVPSTSPMPKKTNY